MFISLPLPLTILSVAEPPSTDDRRANNESLLQLVQSDLDLVTCCRVKLLTNARNAFVVLLYILPSEETIEDHFLHDHTTRV